MLSNLNRDNYEPYSAPEEKGSGGTVILVSVLGVLFILFVGLALLWRGRRKRAQGRLDEWGLPVRVLVCFTFSLSLSPRVSDASTFTLQRLNLGEYH